MKLLCSLTIKREKSPEWRRLKLWNTRSREAGGGHHLPFAQRLPVLWDQVVGMTHTLCPVLEEPMVFPNQKVKCATKTFYWSSLGFDQMPASFNWPHWMQTSCSSTKNSHQMMELLTHSARPSPASLFSFFYPGSHQYDCTWSPYVHSWVSESNASRFGSSPSSLW